jgi:hypothetical protein
MAGLLLEFLKLRFQRQRPFLAQQLCVVVHTTAQRRNVQGVGKRRREEEQNKRA